MRRVIATACLLAAACGSPASAPALTLADLPVRDCSDLSAIDDARFWNISRSVPAFAGAGLDSGGNLVIALTDLEQGPAARAFFPEATSVRFVKVRFSWEELLRVKCQTRDALSIGAVFLDLDESRNLVVIGAPSAATATVQELIDARATPPEAATVVVAAGVKQL